MIYISNIWTLQKVISYTHNEKIIPQYLIQHMNYDLV